MFSLLFFCVSISGIAQSFQTANIKVANRLLPGDGPVKIGDFLGRRMDQCISNRVLAQNFDKIIMPFRALSDGYSWRCEYFGKCFDGTLLACDYDPTPENKELCRSIVYKLLSTQAPDGYIGTYKDKNHLKVWDVWGHKYTLLGLLDYYQRTHDQTVLTAACRLADQMMAEIATRKVNLAENGVDVLQGLPSCSILEPMTMLYEVTGQKKYLDFCNDLVAKWSLPNKYSPHGMRLLEDALAGVPPVEICSPKAYEMTSCFEGLCELYRITGDKKYLAAAVDFGNSVLRTERMINGSASNQELWCDGVCEQTETLEQPMETCVTVTWMRFCYELLQLTGDPKWADEMERSLYNALLGALMPQGNWWAYFSPLIGERVPSPQQQKDVGLSCCVANGPRALLLTPKWAVMRTANGLTINLYNQSTAAETLSDGTAVTLKQQTDYPVGGDVKITLSTTKPKRFDLNLRIPEWSKITVLTVKGREVKCVPGTYVTLNEEWHTGDTIDLQLDMRGRVIPAPSGAPELAVMRGPIVLALDNRLVKPAATTAWLLPEPVNFKKTSLAPASYPGYILPKPFYRTNEEIFIPLTVATNKSANIWMAFDAPFLVRPSHFFRQYTQTLTLCDYASAGNAWSETNLFRVWMPQPMFMGNMFPADTWEIITDHKPRLTAP